jgi:tRNA A-37 threonylcarbamoyl transferase component Bud32
LNVDGGDRLVPVIHTGYADRVKPLLGPDWHLHQADLWLHAHSSSGGISQVLQGFKIHVSATLACASQVIDLVVPACVQSDVEFKVARSQEQHRLLNAKHQRRGSSGKFMTLYPHDTECFKSMLTVLHELTRNAGVEGPRVLSDRQYADSAVISYRYGGFRPAQEVRLDGTYRHVILSPDGARVDDDRKPWFQLPSWVEDPFPPVSAEPEQEGVVLGGRFRVEHAIRFSNSGGIYFARDLQKISDVVVKEARPHTHYWSDIDINLDAADLLRREYDVLLHLAGVPAVPEPVSFLSEGGHTFLVESFVTGLTFHEHFASQDLILAPYLRSAERVRTWSREFFRVAVALLDAVAAVHERGVLMGDLSTHNIIVAPDGRSVGLVDLESAVIEGDNDPAVLRYAAEWGTAGFYRTTRPLRERLSRAGDFSALGLVLLSALIPVNPLFGLKPGATGEFLATFLKAGVPAEVGEVVEALMDGEAGSARKAIERGRALHG